MHGWTEVIVGCLDSRTHTFSGTTARSHSSCLVLGNAASGPLSAFRGADGNSTCHRTAQALSHICTVPLYIYKLRVTCFTHSVASCVYVVSTTLLAARWRCANDAQMMMRKRVLGFQRIPHLSDGGVTAAHQRPPLHIGVASGDASHWLPRR